MKSLLKFTEEQLDQMSGEQLHSIYENHHTYGGFYSKLSEVIVESNAFFDWMQKAIEDPQDEELSAQLEYTLQRTILRYIKLHYKGLIEDRIYDYLDYQDMRKDPAKYYGCGNKNFYGVENA